MITRGGGVEGGVGGSCEEEHADTDALRISSHTQSPSRQQTADARGRLQLLNNAGSKILEKYTSSSNIGDTNKTRKAQ